MKRITITLIIFLALFSNRAFCQNSGELMRSRAYDEIENKKYDDALSDLNTAMTFYQNDDKSLASIYFDRAYVLNKLERYEEAIRAASRSISLNPKAFTSYVIRGKSYLYVKNYQFAIDDETEAITHLKKDNMVNLRSAYIIRSSAERHLKDYPKSIDDCTKLISLDTKNGQGYWERGLTYNASGDYPKAIADFTTSLTYYLNDEDDQSILFDNRAAAERNMDNYKAALTDDSVSIFKNPESGLGNWGKASTLKQMENYKGAIDQFDRAITKYKDDKDALAQLYLEKALCEENLEEYANAIKDVKVTLSFNPEFGNAYWIRGFCNEQVENYKAAIDDATTALKYYQDDKSALASIYCNRGHAKVHLKMYGKAMEDYSSAISSDPNSGRAHKLMAFAYQDSGLYQLAIDEFTKALDFYKEDNDKDVRANIYSNVGFVYSRLKNYQQAVDNETKAIDIDQAHTYSYCERGRNYLLLDKKDEAVTDFKKALQLDTTDRTYAYSLFFSGDAAKALTVIKRKITDTSTTREDLANAYYDLACLMSLQNKPKEALTNLKKAFDTGHSRFIAYSDPDLANISSTPEFKELVK